MCVIIVKTKGRSLPDGVAEVSARINPDGLGVVWLDNYNITYHKSTEWRVLETDRPFIAHFRYATVGKVGLSNTHPFQCGKSKDEYLMMNGHICGLGNSKDCDSKLLARALGEVYRSRWSEELSKYACRFVTVNRRKKSYQIYNKDLWTKVDGVWFSKTNVLERNYVAVYGTLKKGNGNYYNYLSDSTFVGHGRTKEKRPLIIEGLPYLVDKVGVGHKVKVDVFRVSDGVLANLDRLEGHPNWYKRKQIPIVIGRKEYMCWVYMMDKPIDGKKLHESYEYKPTYAYRQYDFDFDWEPKHKPEPKHRCPLCVDVLDSDAYGHHYCFTCEEWFTDNDLSVLEYTEWI